MKRTLFSLLSAALLITTSCSQEQSSATTEGTSSTTTAETDATATSSDSMSSMSGNDTTMSASGGDSAMADPNGPTAPHKDDAEFMKSAAHSDQNEIQLSRLVLEKGATGMAKDHANMMITDHTKSTADLKAIAQKKNVTLPTDMDAEHKAIAASMQKLSGKDLEQKFMQQMVTDHQKTLNTMAAHQAMTKDADLQGFITKTTPVIIKHLDTSKQHSDMKM